MIARVLLSAGIFVLSFMLWAESVADSVVVGLIGVWNIWHAIEEQRNKNGKRKSN